MRVGKPTAHLNRLDPLIGFLVLAISIAVLVLIMPQPVAALAFPGTTGIPKPPVSQLTYETYLQATGRPSTSRYNAYVANYQTYASKRLLVYGTPDLVPDNRYDTRFGEYAYLGFSYDETPVTNTDFPDDSATGATYTSPWDWEEQDLGLAAEISWARLSESQRTLISQSSLSYRRDTYGGMDFAGLGLTAGNSIVLAPPAWHLGFALYTRHDLPGTTQLRYATFTGPGSGQIALYSRLDILTPLGAGNTLVIPAGASSVELRYRLSGWISQFGGLAALADLANCGVGNSLDFTAGSGLGPWTIELVQSVPRTYLGTSVTKNLTVSGQAWAVSWMGDIFVSNASQTIEVVDGAAVPFTIGLYTSGSLDYFAHRDTAFDYNESRDRHRYLGLEKVTFAIDFSHPTESASLIFLGKTYVLNQNSANPATHFEVEVTIPSDRQTLSWQHLRLTKSHLAEVRAQATVNGVSAYRVKKLSDIEVTGDIHDLNRVLAGLN
ncbi:MAG: hypothetical protein PHQ83_04750 [Eubacteriales bacterium]|nr:hypothetical protein [Eubacteriales bacterium]